MYVVFAFELFLWSKARENGVSVEMTEEELMAGVPFSPPKCTLHLVLGNSKQATVAFKADKKCLHCTPKKGPSQSPTKARISQNRITKLWKLTMETWDREY